MKSKPNLKILSQGLGALILTVLTLLLLTNPRPWFPVLDEANLMIHESGHVFFATLGEFSGMLGGSLMQILVPAGAVIYFKFTKQKFGTAFALFWLGESLVNVSLYIKDARTMLLPLVNGGTHDWNWILGKMQLLKQDTLIGTGIMLLGAAICLTGTAIAVYTFLKNSKQLAVQNSVR